MWMSSKRWVRLCTSNISVEICFMQCCFVGFDVSHIFYPFVHDIIDCSVFFMKQFQFKKSLFVDMFFV